MKKFKRMIVVVSALSIASLSLVGLTGCDSSESSVVLRVSNWEEYIDLGDWDEEELIDIDNPYAAEGEEGIIGVNSMIDDFTEWFNQTHDYTVKVEYSTFGTNEDLYNRLSLGDQYDLVCPSDYMIMKLLDEDKILAYSEQFLSQSAEENYYTQNVSPYISEIFEDNGWSEYAACYMWGTTGIVYNADEVDVEDVKSWDILLNSDYYKQVTVKDNVRDAYFAALAILNSETLTSSSLSDEERSALLNDTDSATIAAAEDILKRIKENVYSFETDSGKSDMVTGKVLANFQWSGDAVYILDEADGDESNPTELWYSVPDECTNLWFDGWVMLKDGIGNDAKKQEAAEAFVNFLSRPDNAIRNMYYIGYTSSIADDTVFDYMDWNYGAEEDLSEDEIYEYDLSYFFGEGYVLATDVANFEFEDDGTINRGRQLFAQYPPQNVIDKSVIMLDFGDKLNEINQMWINVRCLDLIDFDPVAVGVTAGIVGAIVLAFVLYRFRYKIFIRYTPKKGFEKVESV